MTTTRGDVIDGSVGADTLVMGDDTLSVVKVRMTSTAMMVVFGSDTLIGGGGSDVVDGGQDDDLLELDGSAGVTAEGGDGTDTVVLVGETNEAFCRV